MIRPALLADPSAHEETSGTGSTSVPGSGSARLADDGVRPPTPDVLPPARPEEGGILPSVSWSDVFRNDIDRDRDLPVLNPLAKPCGDCAVTCGFYTEISEALSREPEDVQRAVSEKWFCHNDATRACRGNIDLLAVKAGMVER